MCGATDRMQETGPCVDKSAVTIPGGSAGTWTDGTRVCSATDDGRPNDGWATYDTTLQVTTGPWYVTSR
ncbi:hypothetical protein SK128_026950 [Halocaridina rubra]|uniref:Uncharacterized protein n=1 Tax=Halocaridina rubra TaxID=373956 RepID=A0AAN8WRA3_HALRR